MKFGLHVFFFCVLGSLSIVKGAAVLSEEGRDIETSEASSDRNATCVAEPSVAKTSAKGLTAFLRGSAPFVLALLALGASDFFQAAWERVMFTPAVIMHSAKELMEKARAGDMNIPYKCINDNHLKALSRRGVEVRGVLGAEAQGVALDVIRDRGDPIVAKISPNENRNVLRVLKNNPHPSIIGYRDFWRAGWFDFVLMEKFGKNLRYPKAAGLVSERDALTCVKDVGEGLAHLTKIGIRHNDLHKGNVVFKDGRCKIIDFGLATAGNTEPGLRDNVLFVDKLTLLAEIESASVEKISALLFDAPVKMQEALNRESSSSVEPSSGRWRINLGQSGNDVKKSGIFSNQFNSSMKLDAENKVVSETKDLFSARMKELKIKCLAGSRPADCVKMFIEGMDPFVFLANWANTKADWVKGFIRVLVWHKARADLFLRSYMAVIDALLDQKIPLADLAANEWYLSKA